jgi:NAD(P)-dependent dehydrogenase (short-subunit alcohol dehydrogenase family)
VSSGIEGRVVIITGVGRGIGHGLATHFARNGASLVLAEISARRLEAVAGELADTGADCLAVECDVAERASVEQMVDRAIERFGRIDAIVNNAVRVTGVIPFEDLTDDDMDVVYRTAVKGTMYGMQAVFPHMRDAGYGRIVNVGSGAAILGLRGYGPYNAAKEGVRALTRTAAREWGKHGIIVNAYCPASFAHNAAPAGSDEFRNAAMDKFWNQHPLGRVGDAEHDVGPVVAFLCSEGCRYMTGETVMVDGGAYMWA